MSKKKTNSNVVHSILAILLVVVIICGVITHGFQDWTVCGCFGHKYGEDGVCIRCKSVKPTDGSEQNAVVDNDGNVMDSDQVFAMPAGMVFSSAKQLNAAPSEKAGNSVAIKAVIEPAAATDKSVDWTLAFVNANSEWANGKTVTDYVTVTPTSDGSLTATVTCKQPFAEKIVITVRSRSDTAVTATCSVDFKQVVESVTLTYAHNGETAFSVTNISGQAVATGKIPVSVGKASTATEYTAEWSITKSVGTIALDDSKCVPSAKLVLSSDAKSYMEGVRDNAGISYQPFSGYVNLSETQKFNVDNGTVFGNFFYCGSLEIIKNVLINYPPILVINCGGLTIETPVQYETQNLYTAVTNITLAPEKIEF